MSKRIRAFRALGYSILLLACLLIFYFKYSQPLFSFLNNPSWFEHFLTKQLQQPIFIDKVKFSWKGLQPIAYIQDLKIANAKGETLLKVNKLAIGLDLFASLLKWKMLPGEIRMEGSHIILKETFDGKVNVNNIPAFQADLKSIHSEKLQYLISCFLTDGIKELRKVDISWYDPEGRLKFPIREVTFYETNRLFQHSFNAQLILGSTPIHLEGALYSNIFNSKLLYSKILYRFNEMPLENNSWAEGLISSHGKLNIRSNFSLNIDGSLEANALKILNPKKHSPVYQLDRLQTHFFLQKKVGKFLLLLNELQAYQGGNLLPMHEFALKRIANDNYSKTVLSVDNFSLDEVKQLAKNNDCLATSYQTMLNHLKPSGQVSDFSLEKDSKNNTFIMSGNLLHFSLQHWGNYPELHNINGAFRFSPKEGLLNLKSTKLNFVYPMFRSPLMIQDIKGHIYWHQNKMGNWQIESKDLSLGTKEASAKGKFLFLMPKNFKNPYIDSHFTFTIFDVGKSSCYLPVTLLPEKVVIWLDKAIKNGRVDKGTFILKGNLQDFPFDHGEGKFIIRGNLEQGKLHYQDGWPDIDDIKAQLLFDKRLMRITSSHGKISGAKINFVQAQIDNLGKAILSIHGALSALPNLKLTLNKSSNPLQFLFQNEKLQDISIGGKWALDLNFSLPLDDALPPQTHVSGNLKLDNTSICLPQINLNLKNLQGALAFHENSAETRLITGSYSEKPFQLKMASQQVLGGKRTSAHLQASVAMADLQEISQLPLLKFLKGQTLYDANLDLFFPKEGRLKTSLAISSQLQGVESNLPCPFNKSKTTTLPTNVYIDNKDNSHKLIFTIGKISNGVLSYRSKNGSMSFDRGHIVFGDKQAQAQLPLTSGLKFTGNLAELSLPEWKKIKKTNKGNGYSLLKCLALINQVDLKVNRLQLSNQWVLGESSITTFSRNDGLSYLINSSSANGEIQVPSYDRHQPIKVLMKSLYFPAGSIEPTQLLPRDIPALDVSIENLFYKQKHISHIDVKLRPKGNDLLIKQILMKDSNASFSASGIWREVNGHHVTLLNGSIKSNNLGAFLNQWQFTDNMVKGRGGANFNLSWQNTPLDPESKSLNGLINLHFTQGRISKLTSQVNFGMGIGRILTLFSLQTLPRRLTLDFSDLTKPGYSFDEMEGLLQFKGGNIFTENASIDGPVAKVSIKGRIGLVNKDYNLRLTINPYVTSSLPVVATITAGPIAGAATWLIDKVLSHQVKQMTAIHYNVTGTWNNPNLKTLSETTN
jgi:uncharacterized protein (TIGR02099 family)